MAKPLSEYEKQKLERAHEPKGPSMAERDRLLWARLAAEQEQAAHDARTAALRDALMRGEVHLLLNKKGNDMGLLNSIRNAQRIAERQHTTAPADRPVKATAQGIIDAYNRAVFGDPPPRLDENSSNPSEALAARVVAAYNKAISRD
jgi:hypothetical protein